MKRLTCLLIVLCLLLAACGSKPADETTVPSTEAPTEAPTTEATEQPTTEATEPETEPPAPANPLTGEPMEDYYTARPVAFSLNNISACLPQYGLDTLDWMFEVETEGGITRCLGIMTDRSEERRVGKECRSRWSPYH